MDNTAKSSSSVSHGLPPELVVESDNDDEVMPQPESVAAARQRERDDLPDPSAIGLRIA